MAAFASSTPRGLLGATKVDVRAFAQHRSEVRSLSPDQLMTSPSWANTVRALTSFYAYAERQSLVARSASPVLGIFTPSVPPASIPIVGVKQGGLYDRVLHVPGLSDRDRALLFCLAHGLTPGDVQGLRIENVDAEAREILVRRGARTWVIPMTAPAMEVLARWIHTLAGSNGWVFSGAHRRRATTEMVRAIVSRAATLAFPHPQQSEKRRAVRPIGFAQVYLRRLVRSRIAPDALAYLTRLKTFRQMRPYVVRGDARARAHVELARLSRRWRRRWI